MRLAFIDRRMMQREKPSQDDQDDDSCTRNYGSAMIPLGGDFEPGQDDVLVGRSKMCRNWIGNARFRDLVLSRLDEYSAATSKLEKSAIVTSILYSVRTRSPKGGFIKKDPLTGEWYEVGDFVARERVTQCFRDALHEKYKSSNSSKKKRRKEELQKAKNNPTTKKLKSSDNSRITAEMPLQGPLGGVQSMLFPANVPSSMLRDTTDVAHTQPLENSFVSEPAVASELNPAAAFFRSTRSGGDESTLLQHPMQRLPHQDTLQQQGSTLQSLHSSTSQIPNFQENKEQGSQIRIPNLQISNEEGQPNQYPNRWLSATSGVLSHFPLNAQGYIQPNTYNTVINAAGTIQSMTPGGLPLPNETFGSSATIHNNQASIQAAGLPPQPPLGLPPAAMGRIMEASSTMNFDDYPGDDNPFEPVPISESIARRHAEGRGKKH